MKHEDTFAFQRGTVVRVNDFADSEYGRRLTLRSFCVDNTVPDSLAVVKFWTEEDEYYEYTVDKLELVFYKLPPPLMLPPPVESASERLYAALQWLVDDMSDAGEDANPETGEVFDSVENARKVLAEFGYLAKSIPAKDRSRPAQ